MPRFRCFLSRLWGRTGTIKLARSHQIQHGIKLVVEMLHQHGAHRCAVTSGQRVDHALMLVDGALPLMLSIIEEMVLAESLQPIAVDEAELAIGTIDDVGPGGHFFGTDPSYGSNPTARNWYTPSYSFYDNARYVTLSQIFGAGFVPIGCH